MKVNSIFKKLIHLFLLSAVFCGFFYSTPIFISAALPPICTDSTDPAYDPTDASCSPTTPPTNSPAPGTGTTTTPKPADTTTPKPATPTPKSDGPAIGGLKNCTVDSNATLTPKQGNEKLRDCLRDIIQLVITIAVLISVASLAGYGIQLMNPMETSGKIQGQIAQRITELAVGGVILGMFGTILATINPATLTTSKIFGESAVATFREFIKAGQGTTNAGISKGTGATPGAGGTTSGGSSDPILTSIQKPDKTIDVTKLQALIKDPAKKIELEKLVTKNDQCEEEFAITKDCSNYSLIKSTTITELKNAGINSKHTPNADLSSPIFANFAMTFKKDSNDTSGVYTATYQKDGKSVTQKFKITGKAGDLCPVANLNLVDAVKPGEEIIKANCSIKIVK
jgi:hypothetical protein